MNARGSRSRYVLCAIAGPEAGQSFPVAEATTIGRDPTSWIVVADGAVSRQHAVVRCGTDGLVVEDLGSSNGTRLNGTRIGEPSALSVGDEIGVGPALFRLEAEAPSGVRRRSPPPLPAAPPPVPAGELPTAGEPSREERSPVRQPVARHPGTLLAFVAAVLAFVGGLLALVLLP